MRSTEGMASRWIIPDVHGCVKTLQALVEKQLQLRKFDALYLLGDYIDRGPDGKAVLDYLMDLQDAEYQIFPIKGNHEAMCVDAFRADQKKRLFGGKSLEQRQWEQVGAKETLLSFGVRHPREIPQKYIDWMEACLPYVELESYVLVHAGMNFDAENPFDDTDSMLWTRSFKVDFEKSHGKKVIHGHIPCDLSFIDLVIKENERYDFVILDNGVFVTDLPGYGNLLAYNVDTKELVVQSNLDM
ncbi:MAG: serine/threonine protein phosphatase [Bacteroidales bacterium]|nr:serine/threonine protein phosphatase [Bacteroidales bacterium]